jgi:hypothetical protein
MPQLGVLFDTHKLGTGFYGYTSFRIFFSLLRPEDLVGCTLLHGELAGDDRSYCIAVDTESFEIIEVIRRKLAHANARALKPVSDRFLDTFALDGERLVEAVEMTETGEPGGRRPRWLMEAWQRSQSAAVAQAPAPAERPQPRPAPTPAPAVTPPSPPPPAAPPPVTAEPKHSLRLPERVPFSLWWSHHGRRSFALMVAFCCGGAMLPWLGCGVSLCIILTVAGLVQGLAMQWRVWTELQLCDGDFVEELRRYAAVRPLDELVARLDKAGPQASPLLRAIQSVTRSWLTSQDPAVVTQIVEHNRLADGHMQLADNEELRFVAWAIPAIALCSFYGMQLFVGVRESWMEAPRLALAGIAGWMVVTGLRCSVWATAERMWGDAGRLAARAGKACPRGGSGWRNPQGRLAGKSAA